MRLFPKKKKRFHFVSWALSAFKMAKMSEKPWDSFENS